MGSRSVEEITELTVMQHVQFPLTEREKREMSEELVRTINDKKRMEDGFALMKQQHTANMKARDTKINELSQELGQGFVMRPVKCEQVPDLNRNALETRRLDNGEKVGERALAPDEVRRYLKQLKQGS